MYSVLQGLLKCHPMDELQSLASAKRELTHARSNSNHEGVEPVEGAGVPPDPVRLSHRSSFLLRLGRGASVSEDALEP